MICPEIASALLFLFHELIHMKKEMLITDYLTNCQFVLCKGREGSSGRKEMLERIQIYKPESS